MANALMAAAGAPRRNAAATALSPAAQSAAAAVVPEPTQQPNAMDVGRVDRDLPVDPSTVTFLKTKYPAQADASDQREVDDRPPSAIKGADDLQGAAKHRA
jgi:hypothetical protein